MAQKVHKTKIQIRSDHAQAVTGLKAVRRHAGRMVPSLNSVKTAMLLTTAAAAGLAVGLFALTKSAATTGDEFDKMSKRLDISAQTLSELSFAAELSGASIEDIEKSIKKLSLSAVNADRGLATYKRAFDELKVSIRDNNGNLKDAETLFNDVSIALVKQEVNTKKQALALEVLGKSGVKLLPLFKEGVGGIEALMAQARLFGITYSDAAAASSAAFIDAETRFKKSFEGIKTGIALDLMPPMTDFFNSSAKWIASNRTDVLAMANDWITAIGGMALSAVVGGAELTSWLSDRLDDINGVRLGLLKLEELRIKAALAIVPDRSTLGQALRANLLTIQTEMVDIYNDHIDHITGPSAAEKVKKAIAEIRELLRTAEQPPVTPNIPDTGVEDTEGEVTGPKALAAQREIDQLNAMWDQHFLTESERLDMWFVEQQNKLGENIAAKLTLHQIFIEKKKQLDNKEKKAAEAKKKTESDLNRKTADDFISNLQVMGQSSRTAFEAWKIGAIARTIITTYEGAQKAFTALADIPIVGPALGAAAAAAAIGAGLARVQAIKSQTFGGGGTVSNSAGGSVSTPAGTFDTPALLPQPAPGTAGPFSFNLTINDNRIVGDAIDSNRMSEFMDMLAPFLEESIADKVVNINVS